VFAEDVEELGSVVGVESVVVAEEEEERTSCSSLATR